MFIDAFLYLMPIIILLWLLSVVLKNASIVDIFWGIGFIILSFFYYYLAEQQSPRAKWIVYLVTIWGLRLSVFLFIRNSLKVEDYRYQAFREKYGPDRYWWFSFFQVFLLQAILMWIISSSLYLGIQSDIPMNYLDILAIAIILISIYLEAKADLVLYQFKQNPANKGKTCKEGLWRYSRHPNYFFESCVWLGFALMAVSAGEYLGILSYFLILTLLLKVSGVSLLEKNLISRRENYNAYINDTSAFIPRWKKNETSKK
jgi:steroid 5-alpha reductase family enzyme